MAQCGEMAYIKKLCISTLLLYLQSGGLMWSAMRIQQKHSTSEEEPKIVIHKLINMAKYNQ